jgi:hypothetical protein
VIFEFFHKRWDWSAPEGPQFSPGYQKFGLIARTGRHRNFPLDTQSFDFTLDFDTKPPHMDLPLDAVRLTNCIEGFYIPCDDTTTVTWESSKQLGIHFYLLRNRSTQHFAFGFVVVALIFACIIIFKVKDTHALPVPVALYFI